jgi:hypothetical protein
MNAKLRKGFDNLRMASENGRFLLKGHLGQGNLLQNFVKGLKLLFELKIMLAFLGQFKKKSVKNHEKMSL